MRDLVNGLVKIDWLNLDLFDKLSVKIFGKLIEDIFASDDALTSEHEVGTAHIVTFF